jgi:hypothetical protein
MGKVVYFSLSQRVRVEEQLSENVRVRSLVPQRGVFVSHLFLVCVNYIWTETELTIRLMQRDCTIHWKIVNGSNV